MKQAAYRIAIVAVLLGLAAAPAAELDGFQDLDRLQDADLPSIFPRLDFHQT